MEDGGHPPLSISCRMERILSARGQRGSEDEKIWPVLFVPCCMHWVPPKLASNVPNAGLGN